MEMEEWLGKDLYGESKVVIFKNIQLLLLQDTEKSLGIPLYICHFDIMHCVIFSYSMKIKNLII